MANDIMQHQQELESKLWDMANTLRGTMEAYELHPRDDLLLLFVSAAGRVYGEPFKR